MHWNPITGQTRINGIMPIAAYRPMALASASTPLADGDAGVSQTIATMNALVDQGVKDPTVNRTAIDIIRGIPAFQQNSDLQRVAAIYNYVLRNFAYVHNPMGPSGEKETLRPVIELLHLNAGDCKNMSVLIATLCGTVGYRTRFVTVAADADAPDQFSHVYPEVLVDGAWIPMDCARPGAQLGLAPENVYRSQTWEVPATQTSMAGVYMRAGIRSKNGYRRLGNLGDDSTVAQDISATGTSVANIIAASNPNSFYTGSSAGAINPSLLTPGSSAYSVNPLTGQLQLGGTTNITTLLFVGVGALVLLMAMRK
jgi:Transglutaminase-like superfamily